MTGIVVVSHSHALAKAAVELAQGLLPVEAKVEIAAGLPGGELGTDAGEILAAIERVDDGQGVLVLADLGSGIMSAEMALEMLEPELADRTRLSAAPLVEGLVGAYATAGMGGDLAAVCKEADSAAEAKRQQLSQ